jgi:DNA polymerase-3 subunit epsilon
MTDGGFAIIDFETAALFSDGRERIVEVAVVHTDRRGRVTGLWETLVSPGKDVTSGQLGGLDPAEVAQAPTFEQLAPDLIGLLSGRIIVAHHARYSTGVLLTELQHISDELHLPALCTQQLAEESMQARDDERAADRCEHFSVGVESTHHAVVDAIATARLLAIHLESADSESTEDRRYWDALVRDSAELVWPPLSVIDVEWLAREVGAADPSGFLQRIPSRPDDTSKPAAHVEYFAQLDTALRRLPLTQADATSLVAVAARRRIGREMCEELNRAYFDDLARHAWSSGSLRPADMADLVTVGKELSIPTYVIRGVLKPRLNTDRLLDDSRRNGDDGDTLGRRPGSGVNPAA